MSYKVSNGNVLLAEPFMLDPNFKRAVVLICEHDKEDGTVGFILNKPLEIDINDLIEDFPEFEARVHYGGPVAPNTIHYVHNVGTLLDNSVQIERGVFWGGDFEKLKFLINTELIKPENIKFFLGYSGWSPGQLYTELDFKSWVLAEVHANYVFKSKSPKLWNQVMYHKGDIYSVIAQIPDHNRLN